MCRSISPWLGPGRLVSAFGIDHERRAGAVLGGLARVEAQSSLTRSGRSAVALNSARAKCGRSGRLFSRTNRSGTAAW